MFWRWEYIVIILAQTEIGYAGGVLLDKCDGRKKKLLCLQAVLISILGILFFFKYFNFMNGAIRFAVLWLGGAYGVPNSDFLLPVGISFHTFQTMGYIIDLYRGKIPVEKNFPRFALFVSFFPLLVAGPIERARNLLPQFVSQQSFETGRFTSGARLIMWGLFKKVVIADRLAEYVNRIYAAPDSFSGLTLALATYFFAFQIYCDFSGYSDIAIGSARMLGFDLMENFRLPYLATSISEFWQRWHISLSTWFRDYVYISLGGNRVAKKGWMVNIFAVFLLSGLWHGANWTFLAWGGLHGLYYLMEYFLAAPAKRFFDLCRVPAGVRRFFAWLVTFNLVSLAWVFFRAGSISEAFLILNRIFFGLLRPLYLGPSQLSLYISLLCILMLLAVMSLQSRGILPLCSQKSRLPVFLRWPAYLALLFGIALLGKSSSDFIYFQF
jgi:D-alanyl-lipoteichoic acid acyltransferase DltB (MBOAT superfamily)